MMVTFKSDVKKRKQLFTAESFAHPAKMHLGMLLWVIGKYTKPGETILDPMFGSGSTMLAARYGRNVIGVELEQKFVDMAKGNWDKVRSLSKTKFELGECRVIQGDARNLGGLLADSIITSPPYAETFSVHAGGNMRLTELGRKTTDLSAEEKQEAKELAIYSRGEDNISNLPYGEVDVVLSSPPYADAYSIREGGQVNEEYVEKRKETLRKQGRDELADSLKVEEYSSYNPDNIGNLSYGSVDSISSSPPYEGILQGKDDVSRQKEFSRLEKRGIQVNPANYSNLVRGTEYSKEADNIGNLRRDTYLEAMLQVYQQCYKVLKPNGLMILVTKDFIRKGQRILLSIDTIALCEQAGFAYEDWHQRKLTQQSFWRTLYYKKHPEVERLDTEDILVFRKPSGEGVVDAVVTSPPYAETRPLSSAEPQQAYQKSLKHKIKAAHQGSLNNIGNLPYDGAKINDEWIKSRQAVK